MTYNVFSGTLNPTHLPGGHSCASTFAGREPVGISGCPPFLLPSLPCQTTHIRFTALFLGPPRWAGARRELLDFIVQGKINRRRHTDHPAGHHSIRTNQCQPPPSAHIFTGRMPFLPPNQQCQSTEGIKALKACQTSEWKLKHWSQPWKMTHWFTGRLSIEGAWFSSITMIFNSNAVFV